MQNDRASLMTTEVEHINIKAFNAVPLVDAMAKTAFQARNLSRAAGIYCQMLEDKDCAIILTLAGSLISAGMKQIIIDMLENNMIDAIVSTGANIVDQDFFEALGFKHYQCDTRLDDNVLRDLSLDRIYDTLIDENELRICDNTIGQIANSLPHRPHSSREFIREMGQYLETRSSKIPSIVHTAFKKDVPIFVPAFSDCSAGFGLVMHQVEFPESHVTIDSVKDFRELTALKIKSKESGLFMLCGGVPKNFAQDTVVAAELLGAEAPMHKYAVQITVADERDGALSGSTLREASSWGKVSTTFEQMVYCEATIALPLIASYAYWKNAWKSRKGYAFTKMLDAATVAEAVA
jgi:deoxyhypusine synthase